MTGYWYLGPDDIVQAGDEVSSGGPWAVVNKACAGIPLPEFEKHWRFRRPMAAENPKEAAGAQKTPLQLLPKTFLDQTAHALAGGAAKYGRFNWREAGINATTYHGAIARHLSAWADGEDIDPESGLSHLAHIAASCAIILDAIEHGKFNDDRP